MIHGILLNNSYQSILKLDLFNIELISIVSKTFSCQLVYISTNSTDPKVNNYISL
jgi:hypothetical protein